MRGNLYFSNGVVAMQVLALPIVIEQPVAITEMDFFSDFVYGSLLGLNRLRTAELIIKRH